jgi:hypothetical protein
MFNGGKVPTMVAYDEKSRDSQPLAWGTACMYLPATTTIQECFKASLDDKCPPKTNPEPQSVVAGATPQRWMRDYMHLLFSNIIADMEPKLDQYDWKEATIYWVFTVPGSWAEFPAVANFKRLAGEAICLCIGNRKSSKIIIDTSEAKASAYSLLKGGFAASIQGYASGNRVLSCDIGGATTDIAVSQILAPGLLTTPMQLEMHPLGMADISKAFRLHIQQVLDNAGAANSRGVARTLAQKHFMNTFTELRLRTDARVAIEVPGSCSVWCPPENTSANGTRIEEGGLTGKVLLIHK